MEKSQERDHQGIITSSLFATLVLGLGAILNYLMPYNGNPVFFPPRWSQLFMWLLLYLPLVFFPLLFGWKVRGFGFAVNRQGVYAIIIVSLLCGPIALSFDIPWQSAMVEAFARTGEELFFRGFLFMLLLMVFRNKPRPEVWAVLGTSLAFTLVHTQTLQTGYFDSPHMSRVFLILQRFVNLFLLSALFALLRLWSHSILPGAVAHGVLKGGILTLPFTLLIYAVAVVVAHARGENVFSSSTHGGTDQKKPRET